jgi:ABC-type transport system substrate-binding protein
VRNIVVSIGLIATLLIAACGPSGGTPGQAPSGSATQQSGRAKVITIGFSSTVQSMSIMGATTTSGGWQSLNEIHSNGLITSDVHSRRPIPRLAAKLPTVDDGSISVLPDGRMRVVYALRTDATWQDGAPFTSKDLTFSYDFNSDPALPTAVRRDVMDMIDSVEAPDDATFVMYFKGPYAIGGTLGVRSFWPQPAHILGPVYERFKTEKNVDDVVNNPYWTSQYLHLGPFRLTSFDPSALTFEAYQGYFLGRPKVDTIYLKSFTDQNTLFTNLLAGTVDIFPDLALSSELGYQIKDIWENGGGGKVNVNLGVTWFLAPQWRPSVQQEQANLDPKVRGALYRALDREALSDALQGGHRELSAWSLMPPGHQYYDATKDALRQYAYNPDQARADLREAGWTFNPDGSARNATDGRSFKTAIWATVGRDREISAYASYWRQIGLEVDESIVPASQSRNLEYRAQYPGWESSGQGYGDAILGRMDPPAASAATRWVGERGGFEDPRAWDLIARYRASLSDRDQAQAMKAISDYVVAELPFLILFYLPDHLGVRAGVKALDDAVGGAEGAQPYGTYTRNAHLWEVQ